MCEIKDFFWMELTQKHRAIIQGELEWWHEAYLPVKQTVLDLGAGCGETANFYFNHGAQKVICVECDPGALVCLYANFRRDPRVLIIPERIDSLKVDIEGSEEGMVYETHFASKLKKWANINPSDPNAACWRLLKIVK